MSRTANPTALLSKLVSHLHLSDTFCSTVPPALPDFPFCGEVWIKLSLYTFFSVKCLLLISPAFLRHALQLNVMGTQRLLELARQMRNLEAFIHISTAYANCVRKCIEEIIYPPPAEPQKLFDLVE